MSVFAGYARFYDLYYAGKDYDGECDFVERAFARFGARPESLLDLACGTGSHGVRLASRGYQVAGVDRSPAMLAQLREKAKTWGVSVEAHEQDLRSLDLGRSFDAAICLFDAVDYLTENAGLSAFLQGVRRHLRPEGLLLFDFWHAVPLVRGYDPVRVREYPLDGGRVLRISTTSLDVPRQVANVSYRVLVFEGDRLAADFTETHPMRYFLPQEMRFILEANGLETLHLCPAFDLDGPIDAESWHLVAVARAPAG